MKLTSILSVINSEIGINKLKHVIFSLSDQVFSVGAIFLINIVLARTSTEAEYGVFVLVYTLFTFMSGLHNALILEPYTVFAAGRYQQWFQHYLQFMLKINYQLGMFLSSLILFITFVFYKWTPELYDFSLIGLGFGVLFLLSGALFRRIFYVRHDSQSAGLISFYYFLIICSGLFIQNYFNILTGFSVFVLMSLGWLVVSPVFYCKHPVLKGTNQFITNNTDYWSIHWKYSKWVLASAIIFQLVNQGYYWITASILNVEDVAKLKAVQNIILPINLFFTSLSLLALPRMARVFQVHSVNGVIPIFKKLVLVMLGAAILFIGLIWVAGEEILNLVYAGKYDGSIELLFIISLVPVFFALGNAINDTLKSMEQSAWVFKAYMGGGLVTLLIGIPLVDTFGVKGAAWGMVISSMAYCITLLFGIYTFVNKSKKVIIENL